MSYIIDACLQQGVARLRVLEADSGAVRLVFTDPVPEPTPAACTCGDPCRCPHRQAIQSLFRELFLLSCAHRVGVDARRLQQSVRSPKPRKPLVQ